MDNLTPQSLTSYKAQALSALNNADRLSLLAAAGAIGLSSDDDPFWFTQSILTQCRGLIAASESNTAASRKSSLELLEMAKFVLSQFKPSAAIAQTHIEQTVKRVEENLTQKAAQAVALAVTVEIRKGLREGSAKQSISGKLAGAVTASFGLTLAFLLGMLVSRQGWGTIPLPEQISAIGMGPLLLGQCVIIAASVWWINDNPH